MLQGPSSLWIPPGQRQIAFELQCLDVSESHTVNITAEYEDLSTTASLTVQAGIPLVLLPPTVVGGVPLPAMVILRQPAPHGGSSVAFSVNPPLLQFPDNVTVPEAEMLSRFEITTEPVGKSVSVSVRATSGNLQDEVHVMVRPRVQFRIERDPSRRDGFYRGVVTLAVPCPKDTRIEIHDGEMFDVPQAYVVLRQGNSSVQFPITSTIPYPVDVTITYDGVQCQATTPEIPFPNLDDTDVALTPSDGELGLELVACELTDNASVALLRLELAEPSPEGRTLVQLRSNDPAIEVPATIEIPSGSTSQRFTSRVPADGQAVRAVITASVEAHGEHAAELTVVFPPHFDVQLDADRKPGGYIAAGTVRLSGPAPEGGARFEVICRDPDLLRVPNTVVIPADEREATFVIETRAVAAEREARLAIRYEGGERTVRLKVTADFELAAYVDPRTEAAGGTLRLSSPAPIGGATILVGSSDWETAQVPQVVTIPAGETATVFPIQITGPPKTVTIFASYAGVNRAALLEFLPSDQTLPLPEPIESDTHPSEAELVEPAD